MGTFQLYTRNEISLTLLLDPRQKINHYWQVSVILYTKKELIKLVYCINISNRLCQSNDLCNPFQFWDFKIPNTCQTIVGSFQHLQIRRKKLEKKKVTYARSFDRIRSILPPVMCVMTTRRPVIFNKPFINMMTD